MRPAGLDDENRMITSSHNYKSAVQRGTPKSWGPIMTAHWDDLKTVMHLVRGGSLANAAGALGVSYTTVARRVKRAEDDLGFQLFERLADGYQATEAGHEVARKATAMEIQEHDLMRGLVGSDKNLSGVLTITAPQLLCNMQLSSVFLEFTSRYPDVDLHVRAATELLDLNRREADLAIRVSNQPGDSLMGRRLTSQQSAVFGTKFWADQIQESPLQMVDWVMHDSRQDIKNEVTADVPNMRARFRTDDMTTMISAARTGMGVIRMPVFLGLEFSDLYQIPQLPAQSFPDIWMVAHRDVWPSARVAAFREILLAHFMKAKTQFVTS